jgi:DNA adenine methylase
MKLFRYPGAKSNKDALRQITSHFPSSFQEYRESFVGGGSVFATIDASIPRWINDLNRPLIAVYEALKARPQEFAALCHSISPFEPHEDSFRKVNGISYPIRLFNRFHQLLQDDDADAALRYLFLNRCAWNGRVILDKQWRHRTSFSNPKGWSAVLNDRLAAAANIVADAKITCSDFEWLFDEPGEDVFIYSDPPYVVETNLTKGAKLYECGFSMEDHTRLRDCALLSKHKLMISYDDHPLIRDLYREFYIHEAAWTYNGQRDKRKGRELIITNYACCSTRSVIVSVPEIPRTLAA